MALNGAAKTSYQFTYMRHQRARARASRQFSDIDRNVLTLAQAGYLNCEIAESLALTDRAVTAALGRVAEYLAPTLPYPRLVVDPADCLPFIDDRFSEAS